MLRDEGRRTALQLFMIFSLLPVLDHLEGSSNQLGGFICVSQLS